MGFADAATIGGCVVAPVGLANLHERHLALPGSPQQPFGQASGKPVSGVLVYGGSTVSGMVTIQFLKLCVIRLDQSLSLELGREKTKQIRFPRHN